jgi:hypothetical protein
MRTSANGRGWLGPRWPAPYAQWRSRDDVAAMQADEQAREHMSRAAALASFEPIVCEVVSVHHA